MMQDKDGSKALPVDVFLISSTLHFFWAYMLATKNKLSRKSHLIAIDQYAARPLLMMDYLSDDVSPFSSVQTWEGRELKGIQQRNNRKQKFAQIDQFLSENDVERIFIGNDRSVIGQYFIKQAKSNNPAVKGCFLDDGVYSYLGRKASNQWSEKYVNAFLKKMAYGFWYEVPQTVGASKWIDEAWVMYPEQVNTYLKSKKRKEILPSNSFCALKLLSEKIFKEMGIQTSTLESIEVFITLPNESVFSTIKDYQSNLSFLVKELIKAEKKVAIKYHPATCEGDPLQLESLGAYRLPSNLSFELFIPYLQDSTVIGDFSTTVLMVHYSKFVSVVMFDVEMTANNPMNKLCQSIGIDVRTIQPLKEKLLIG